MLRWLRFVSTLLVVAYAAHVGFRLLSLLVFGVSLRGGLLLAYLFGAGGEPGLLVAEITRAFGSEPLAVATAAVVTAALVAWACLRLEPPTVSRAHGATLAAVLGLVLAATVVVDARYGASPVARWLPQPSPDGVELTPSPMTVTEIAYFTRLAPRARTNGILRYHSATRRFSLADPSASVPPIKVHFYERPGFFGTAFADMDDFETGGGLPSSVARPLAERWAGRHVSLTGLVTSGSIRAHVSDVLPAPAEAPPANVRESATATEGAPVATVSTTDDAYESFATDMWPEEGIPRFRARKDLVLRDEPRTQSGDSSGPVIPAGAPFDFTRTRLITRSPAELRLPERLTLVATDFGAGRFLSRDAYYSRSNDLKLRIEPGVPVEVLQYRAEGTWFIRYAGHVFAAACEPCGSVTPEVEWWVETEAAGRKGWVLITEPSVEFLEREY